MAERAAIWLADFHPDVRVDIAQVAVMLTANGWSDAELGAVWRSALANERLFASAADHRAAVLKALVA